MVQYVAILMIYYVLSYAFVGYKNNCHPLEEMPPEAHEYKQLRSGNCYHPLDLPALTVDSSTFRNWNFHKASQSSSLGYPARRLALTVAKRKLTTKFPPFVRKPKVSEQPAPTDKQTAVRALLLRPMTRTDEHGNVYKHFDFRSK